MVAVLDLTTSLAGAYAARLLSAGGFDVTRAEPPDRALAAAVERVRIDDARRRRRRAVPLARRRPVEPGRRRPCRPRRAAAHGRRGAVVTRRARSASTPRRPVPRSSSPSPRSARPARGPTGRRPSSRCRRCPAARSCAARGRGRRSPPAGSTASTWPGCSPPSACQLALRQRALGGPGGLVDVSALESVIMTQLFNPITMETMVAGVRPRRAKATVADVVPTRDGFVGFAVVNRLQHWLDFCTMIGRQDWADDPTLHAVVNRTERSDELNPVIAAWAAERTHGGDRRARRAVAGAGDRGRQRRVDPGDGPLRRVRLLRGRTPTAASSSRRRRSACTRRSPASARCAAAPALGERVERSR